MSEGTNYVVSLELATIGDFAAQQSLARTAGKTKGVDDAITKLRSNIGGFVSDGGSGIERIGRAFDWTAQKAMGVAKWAIAAGGAAAFAGITYGVMGLNSELQKTTVSIGTIFSAQGLAKDVPSGMIKARDTIAQMRKDAIKLPGEYEDLKNIFTTGAVPAFRAGLDEKSWESLSAKAMAAGVTLQVPLDMVAREFSQLISGRAGAHNVFGTKLAGLTGDEAQSFNKLSESKRIEFLSKELDKYAGSIDAFSKTYEAASSGLIDNLKLAGQKATQPLFDRITGSLNEVNDWFAANQARVGVWEDRIGDGLAHAWDEGRKELEEWGPIIIDFGERLYDRFGKVWEEIAPTVQKFGEALKEALKDPGTIDKLMSLAKLYIEAKGVGAVAGFGLGSVHDIAQTAFYLKESYSIIKAIKAAGGLSAGLGLLVNGAPALTTAAAGAGVAAGGAVAAGETAAAGGAAVVGGEAAVGAAAGAAGLGLAGLAGVAALAAFDVGILWHDFKDGSEAFRMWTAATTADSEAHAAFASQQLEAQHQARDASWSYLNQVAEEVRLRGENAAATAGGIELLKQQNQDFDHLIETTNELRDAGDETGAQLLELAYAASNLGAAFEMHDKYRQEQMDAQAAAPMQAVNSAAVYNLLHNKLNNDQIGKLNDKKNKAAIKHGGGGTTNHIQINVASNQDPSRIARAVKTEFHKQTRMPTKSPKTTDFTAPRT